MMLLYTPHFHVTGFSAFPVVLQYRTQVTLTTILQVVLYFGAAQLIIPSRIQTVSLEHHGADDEERKTTGGGGHSDE